ncbi:MAG TPA: peptidase inhibitor family I36 protein [Streptosporangiaceae bacterium]|jgi:hypothetical protein|nr:peptidase inhibitor family I36 protein [Streptosporangiaceae bacterium]
MRRILLPVATLAVAAGAIGFAGAGTANASGPCGAGHFCAYRANDYVGELIDRPIHPSDGDVNVLDNATNSVINHTPYDICGVDGAGFDQTILSVPPAPASGSHRTQIGSLFNKIDWFYARDVARGCDT